MNNIKLNPSVLVKYLEKPSKDFTKDDIIKFISENDIKMLNFRYVGGDGRLKTLNFVINSMEHLDMLLSAGERVDGSSLFSYVEADSSDLYIIPRYRTAFMNPFSKIPTLDIMCSYFDKDGMPLKSSPEFILQKAHQALKEKTGLTMQAMGELEYYIISEKEELYSSSDQKGYHESKPFSKWEDFRCEALQYIAETGASVKYAHSEVGSFKQDGFDYSQNEIEFIPTDIEKAAEELIISKWILRTLACKYNINLTFAPKITIGKAGSGMHVHTKLLKDGKNILTENGCISDNAKKIISGYLKLAPSLTAFGNTIPTSYFRLVPHQEAPTNICWGERNRSGLVRVPLGWAGTGDMISKVNPVQQKNNTDYSHKQTVEFRCSDGSADIYLLLAGLAVAARHGIESEDSLEYAKQTFIDVNIFNEKHKNRKEELSVLPSSCYESAILLEKQSDIYTNMNVFPKGTINEIISELKKFNDNDLRKNLIRNTEETLNLVNHYINYA